MWSQVHIFAIAFNKRLHAGINEIMIPLVARIIEGLATLRLHDIIALMNQVAFFRSKLCFRNSFHAIVEGVPLVADYFNLIEFFVELLQQRVANSCKFEE